jgi:hypothetical protein
MSRPDALGLFNECLSIVEQTTDDKAAERVLPIAFRLLQMAEEEVGLAFQPDSKSASTATRLPDKYVRRADQASVHPLKLP